MTYVKKSKSEILFETENKEKEIDIAERANKVILEQCFSDELWEILTLSGYIIYLYCLSFKQLTTFSLF